jgi:hypothetical protein
MIPSSTFDLSPENLSNIKLVFNHLTHLSLVLVSVVSLPEDLQSTDPDSMPRSYWSDLPKILQALQNITHLALDLRVERRAEVQWQSYHDHDDITELFHSPPLTLPRLTSLTLTCFRTSGLSLLSLLQRHPTIQDLTMRHVIEIMDLQDWDAIGLVHPGNAFPGWMEVLETMRALRLRRLDWSGLEGIGTDLLMAGHENMNLLLTRVYEYVLYGYGLNPLRPDKGVTKILDADSFSDTSMISRRD